MTAGRAAGMDRRAVLRMAAVLGSGAALSTACGTTSGGRPAAESGYANESVTLIAGANPGSGWDQTARAMEQALEQAKLVKAAEVRNVGGASGTVALAQYAGVKSRTELLLTGFAMVSGVDTNKSAVKLDATTPICRLIGEWEAIVVPAASKWQTLTDFTDDWKASPKAIAVAGGSAGSADHVLVALIAKELGIDPKQLNYVPYSGGGEETAALLGGKVPVGVAGAGEFAEQVKAGKLRVLATSGNKALESLPGPTLKESGVDIEFANWRGVLAPKSIADGDRKALIELFDKLAESDAWKQQCDTKGWDQIYISGDDFATWLKEESDKVHDVLVELGLAS